MQVDAILASLKREPSAEHSWRRAALEVGAGVRSATREEIAALIDGIGRAGRKPPSPVILGLRDGLLSTLSGLRQAEARSREQELETEDLAGLAPKPFWSEVVLAASLRKEGIVRTNELSKELGRDKSQVSTALCDMAAAGLFETLKGDAEGDGRARLYRLLPRGRRLAEMAKERDVQRVILPIRAAARPFRKDAALVAAQGPLDVGEPEKES